MRKLASKAKKGFTLVELIVVILIVAILSGVAVGSYFIYIGVANNSADEQIVTTYNTALVTGNAVAQQTRDEIETTEVDPENDNGKIDTFEEAVNALAYANIKIEGTARTANRYYAFSATKGKFYLVNVNDAGTDIKDITYPDTITVDENYSDADLTAYSSIESSSAEFPKSIGKLNFVNFDSTITAE